MRGGAIVLASDKLIDGVSIAMGWEVVEACRSVNVSPEQATADDAVSVARSFA
jgi:hypothetical protein